MTFSALWLVFAVAVLFRGRRLRSDPAGCRLDESRGEP